MKRVALVALMLGLALAACAPPREKVGGNPPKAGDVIQIPAIEWRVVDAATMRKVYIENGGVIGEHQELLGFTGKRAGDGKQILYSTPPKYVNDGPTLTLGHEVLHVVAGDYHQAAR